MPKSADRIATGGAPDQRRTKRQDQFLEAATRLFAERGYRNVGINDISAELGLSGPALYHHYASKEALLVAVMDNIATLQFEGIRDIAVSGESCTARVSAMIRHHIRFVFEQAEYLVAWRTEFRSLPEADRDRLRHIQRLYLDEWVRAAHPFHPGTSINQVRAVCNAVIALMQSPTEFHSGVARPDREAILAEMATVTLTSAYSQGRPSA
jgi:AcrR family transcriptional regulator